MYTKWIRDYLYYQKRMRGDWIHPRELDGRAVSKYLEYLAADRKVSRSTQNQAFSALLFLYKRVLKVEDFEVDAVRAPRRSRLPVVLTVEETRTIINHIPPGVFRLMAGLMYGSGLRLMEACRLRVKDVDFGRKQITVREGKGDKDRMVPLPGRLASLLEEQVNYVTGLHQSDLAIDAGWV